MKYRKQRFLPVIRKSRTAWERTAIQYAEWLAKRDGITLPAAPVKVCWEPFYSSWRKTRRRFWNGTREVEASEMRIRAVRWGCELEIALPGFDFDPQPIEETDLRQAA